jgi:hypothetical protein
VLDTLSISHLIIINERCVVFHGTLGLMIGSWDCLTAALDSRKSILARDIPRCMVRNRSHNTRSMFRWLRNRKLSTDFRVFFGIRICGSASIYKGGRFVEHISNTIAEIGKGIN